MVHSHAPKRKLGKTASSHLILLLYALTATSTGLVVELKQAQKETKPNAKRVRTDCGRTVKARRTNPQALVQAQQIRPQPFGVGICDGMDRLGNLIYNTP